MLIEVGRRYMATVKLRGGAWWLVEPVREAIDGWTGIFTAGWTLSADDSSTLTGEIAMVPARSDFPAAWVASGDLIDVRPL